jgi:hypothetical protein
MRVGILVFILERGRQSTLSVPAFHLWARSSSDLNTFEMNTQKIGRGASLVP